MNIRMILRFCIAILVFTFFNCNIFAPKEPNPDKWYMTGEAWIIEGKNKMTDQEWDGAIEDFKTAIDKDSSLSEAYFYIGKCELRKNNINLKDVWNEINPDIPDKVPFLYPDTVINGTDTILIRDSISPPYFIEGIPVVAYTVGDSVFLERKHIYDAVTFSLKMLEMIHYNLDKMDGLITREIYESDYLVEISIKSTLGIIDINNNDSLDFYSDEREAFIIMCQDISSLDNMELDSLKQISKDPRDIKETLEKLWMTINKADTSYNNFAEELEKGAEKSDKIQTDMADEIGDMIKNFKKIIPFYYYDDFIDNDGDFYNTNNNSTIERMIWIDWDSDERIDIYPPDQRADSGHIHIGDESHINAHPDWYELVDSTDEDYQRYIYKGPYSYEFIAGDWGIDEEILDGEDNDYDGIVDEDTRISADTLDDDNDWFDLDTTTSDTNAIGSESYNPMEWETTNNNFTLEISSVSSYWDTVQIDTLYYSLHKDDYPVYYNKSIPEKVHVYIDTIYRGEFLSGDYGMDEEWYDGIDNDGDGLIDEDVGERLPPESMRDDLIQILIDKGLRGN